MRQKKMVLAMSAVSLFSAVVVANAFPVMSQAAEENGWKEENGVKYWYENGVKQGTEGRGKEIYDSGSDAWYWLDAEQGGAVAKAKDVYMDSDAGVYADNADGTGKWVRYDAEGHMIKGWQTTDAGTYYFDPYSGAMAKGTVVIDGTAYNFDTVTGALTGQFAVDGTFNLNGWNTIDGVEYWFENGVKQGVFGRGKEIYDPGSDAWYWLDSIDGGKKAVSKDVYQESEAGDWAEDQETGTGKWVRYDEYGHMIKGWNKQDGNSYYFDPVYGTMAKGSVNIDSREHIFDEYTGVLNKYYAMVTVDTGNGNSNVLYGWYDVAAAKEMFRTMNDIRRENGVAELEWCDTLEDISKIRAAEVLVSYSGIRPNGTDCTSMSEWHDGENFGRVFYKCKYEEQVNGELLCKIIINPADIRMANLLQEKWQSASTAIFVMPKSVEDKNGEVYNTYGIVQDFSTRKVSE